MFPWANSWVFREMPVHPGYDAIGNTIYSKKWVLNLITKLMKFIHGQVSYTTAFEQELCTLWDMCSEEDVALFGHQNGLLALSIYALTGCQYPKFNEIILGIIGNMCFSNTIRDECTRREDLVEAVFEQLKFDNVGVLLQVMKIFEIFASEVCRLSKIPPNDNITEEDLVPWQVHVPVVCDQPHHAAYGGPILIDQHVPLHVDPGPIHFDQHILHQPGRRPMHINQHELHHTESGDEEMCSICNHPLLYHDPVRHQQICEQTHRAAFRRYNQETAGNNGRVNEHDDLARLIHMGNLPPAYVQNIADRDHSHNLNGDVELGNNVGLIQGGREARAIISNMASGAGMASSAASHRNNAQRAAGPAVAHGEGNNNDDIHGRDDNYDYEEANENEEAMDENENEDENMDENEDEEEYGEDNDHVDEDGDDAEYANKNDNRDENDNGDEGENIDENEIVNVDEDDYVDEDEEPAGGNTNGNRNDEELVDEDMHVRANFSEDVRAAAARQVENVSLQHSGLAAGAPLPVFVANTPNPGYAIGDPRRRSASEEPRPQNAAGDPRRQYAAVDPRQYAAGDPRRQSASGDPRPQNATVDPRQYAAGDPRRQSASGDPRRQLAAGDPRRQYAAGEPRRQLAVGDPRQYAAGEPSNEQAAGNHRPQQAADGPHQYAAGDPNHEHAAGDPSPQHVAGDPHPQNAAGNPRPQHAAGNPGYQYAAEDPHQNVNGGPNHENVIGDAHPQPGHPGLQHAAEDPRQYAVGDLNHENAADHPGPQHAGDPHPQYIVNAYAGFDVGALPHGFAVEAPRLMDFFLDQNGRPQQSSCMCMQVRAVFLGNGNIGQNAPLVRNVWYRHFVKVDKWLQPVMLILCCSKDAGLLEATWFVLQTLCSVRVNTQHLMLKMVEAGGDDFIYSLVRSFNQFFNLHADLIEMQITNAPRCRKVFSAWIEVLCELTIDDRYEYLLACSKVNILLNTYAMMQYFVDLFPLDDDLLKLMEQTCSIILYLLLVGEHELETVRKGVAIFQQVVLELKAVQQKKHLRYLPTGKENQARMLIATYLNCVYNVSYRMHIDNGLLHYTDILYGVAPEYSTVKTLEEYSY